MNIRYAPVGDVPRPVTTLGQVVENQTSGATVAARFLSSDANVEVLAISRISVQRVDELGSDGISLKNSGGAIESNDVCTRICLTLLLRSNGKRGKKRSVYTFALASGAVSLSWPGASASVGVEDQTTRAGDQVSCKKN